MNEYADELLAIQGAFNRIRAKNMYTELVIDDIEKECTEALKVRVRENSDETDELRDERDVFRRERDRYRWRAKKYEKYLISRLENESHNKLSLIYIQLSKLLAGNDAQV